jgi:hypothetical protein
LGLNMEPKNRAFQYGDLFLFRPYTTSLLLIQELCTIAWTFTIYFRENNIWSLLIAMMSNSYYLTIKTLLTLNCQFTMSPLATNTAARLSWTMSLEWILSKFIYIFAAFPSIVSRHPKTKFPRGWWIDSGLRTSCFTIFNFKVSFLIKQKRVTSLLWRAV